MNPAEIQDEGGRLPEELAVTVTEEQFREIMGTEYVEQYLRSRGAPPGGYYTLFMSKNKGPGPGGAPSR